METIVEKRPIEGAWKSSKVLKGIAIGFVCLCILLVLLGIFHVIVVLRYAHGRSRFLRDARRKRIPQIEALSQTLSETDNFPLATRIMVGVVVHNASEAALTLWTLFQTAARPERLTVIYYDAREAREAREARSEKDDPNTKSFLSIYREQYKQPLSGMRARADQIREVVPTDASKECFAEEVLRKEACAEPTAGWYLLLGDSVRLARGWDLDLVEGVCEYAQKSASDINTCIVTFEPQQEPDLRFWVPSASKIPLAPSLPNTYARIEGLDTQTHQWLGLEWRSLAQSYSSQRLVSCLCYSRQLAFCTIECARQTPWPAVRVGALEAFVCALSAQGVAMYSLAKPLILATRVRDRVKRQPYVLPRARFSYRNAREFLGKSFPAKTLSEVFRFLGFSAEGALSRRNTIVLSETAHGGFTRADTHEEAMLKK